MPRRVSLKQTSAAGGILSPQAFSRTDQKKYASGLATCNNAIVPRFGSMEHRGGTRYLALIQNLGVDAAITWDATLQFAEGNIVGHSGVTYVALRPSINVTPGTSAADWSVVSPSINDGDTFTSRTVKFIRDFSTSYELIFTPGNIRVYRDGVPVLINFNDVAAWSNETNYLIGDFVKKSGVVYVCQTPNINQDPATPPAPVQYWKVAISPDAGITFYIDIPVNSATTVAGAEFTIPEASLRVLQAVNLNDVMTITSHYFGPLRLTRFSDTHWQLTHIVTGASIGPPGTVNVTAGVPATGQASPTALIITGGDAGNPIVLYSVTAYGATGESIGVNPAVSRRKGSVGFPAVLTWTAAAGANGYFVYYFDGSVWQFIGSTSLLTFTDTSAVTGAWPAKLITSAPTGVTIFDYVVTAYSAADGSQSIASSVATVTGATPSAANPNVISWTAVAGASEYQVYRIINGVPGSIGITTLLTLNDINQQPDFTQQPPNPLTDPGAPSLFLTSGNWPATCLYFQQRLCFANTVNQPTSVWMSQIGRYDNFNVSTPVRDDDAILFVVAGKATQPIVALVDLQKLVIHTESAEYAATGNQFGTITPSAINCILQGSAGAALPSPITIGDCDLYVQARTQMVRDLRFRIGSYTYSGNDLTIFSVQLFATRTVVQWDWQQTKNSIVWMAMSDGSLYGLTYVPEQEIWAWHTHSLTSGFVEDVCVVPDRTQDTTYVTVRRTINGQSVRYLEALVPGTYTDTVYYTDFWGVDCGLSYDGTVTNGDTLAVTTGGGWTPTDLLTLTANAAHFDSTDPARHNKLVLSLIDSATGLVTDRVTIQILTVTSNTVAHGQAERDVPTWARVTPIGYSITKQWGKAVTHFGGMDFLEGHNLSLLGDGNVLASPLNSAYPTVTVTGGVFTVSTAVLKLTAGLPVQADIVGLPAENAQGESIANRHILVSELTPIFYFSRGGLYSGDGINYTEWDQLAAQPPATPISGQPVAPWTGPCRITVAGTPQRTGFLRHPAGGPHPLCHVGHPRYHGRR